ncbi:MAG: PilZ domain-containing protein [Acidobacteria bacterium]|nr:PilZ domain-containing protein [Acidobacteriota bacterium]
MKVSVLAYEHFYLEFESEAELQKEYDHNISAGGLSFHTTMQLPEFSAMQITLKLTNGGELSLAATVVKALPEGLAVAFETKPDLIWATLMTKPDEINTATTSSEINVWERVRHLSRVEKLLLAPKADRSERQVLLQDNDAQVIFSLLKNPRITVEEVLRIARSSLLSAIAAETIAKTTIWAGNSEIRVALVHNPRTPTAIALKLLPTLPEPDIRQIAKATAVSQALRQAALRIIVNRK